MSRRNPTEGTRNPCTRWFEWAGGDDGGFVRWYNKDTKETIKVEGQFTFLLLDDRAEPLTPLVVWTDSRGAPLPSELILRLIGDAIGGSGKRRRKYG